MRYYELSFRDINDQNQVDAAGNAFGPFKTRKGVGLRLDFDVTYTGADILEPGTVLTIYGVPIYVLRQAVNLIGGSVQLIGGFEAGLPLANPQQIGEILNGRVINAWSDWIGVNQTLNVLINPTLRPLTEAETFSLTVDGKRGDTLKSVLEKTLREAYPEKTVEVSIANDLVLAEAWQGVYYRVAQLASMIKSQSYYLQGVNDNYAGISIVMQGDRILAFDNSYNRQQEAGAAKVIQPYELVGQPSWIGYNRITFKCPLRCDIQCGDIIDLPADITSGPGGILIRSTATLYPPRTTTNISGRFIVLKLRQVGSYLDKDGSSAWVTIYEAIATLQPRS